MRRIGKFDSSPPEHDAIVVVVDDHDGVRDSLVYLLESQGYRVQAAADGFTALRQLRRIKGHRVALVDLLMPDLNGTRLLECLREDADTQDIPVIACSASPMQTTTGFYATLRKPFDISELLATLRDAFVEAELRRASLS